MLTDGITIDSISTNTYITSSGIKLNIHVEIDIKDEDEDVALVDAEAMQSILTNIIKDFVKDYSEDGQEVE